jgi:hypothetical protein
MHALLRQSNVSAHHDGINSDVHIQLDEILLWNFCCCCLRLSESSCTLSCLISVVESVSLQDSLTKAQVSCCRIELSEPSYQTPPLTLDSTTSSVYVSLGSGGHQRGILQEHSFITQI